MSSITSEAGREVGVVFTLMTNTEPGGLLTKKAGRGSDGAFIKEGRTELTRGKFRTERVAWNDFGAYLEGIPFDSAIVLGQSVDGRESGEIVTKEQALALETSQVTGDNQLSPVARCKEQFKFLGGADQLLVLDFDDLPAEVLAGRSCEEAVAWVMERFLKVCPAFRGVNFWIRPSSGAYVYDTQSTGASVEVKGLTGLHAYFRAGDLGIGLGTGGEAEFEQIKKYIVTVSRIAGEDGEGFSFKLTTGDRASVLTRYQVDLSVIQASRLVYSAGLAGCVDCGFVQRNREALYWEAELAPEGAGSIASAGALAITPEMEGAASYIWSEALREFKERTGVAAEQERRDAEKAARLGVHVKVVREHRAMADAGKLSGMHTMLMDGSSGTSRTANSGQTHGPGPEGEVRCWKFVMFPEVYNGATGRDPWEPEYQGGAGNKAIVYCDSETWRARVVSLAHGGQLFTVVMDLESVMEVINDAEERAGKGENGREVLEREHGDSWLMMLRDLTDGERGMVYERLKSLGWFKSKAMAAAAAGGALEKVVGAEQEEELLRELNGLNEWYAEVQMGKGGEVRVLRRLGDEVSGGGVGFQTVFDFRQVQNKRMTVWRDGKQKSVSVGDSWLAWEGRRKLAGVVFRPGPGGEVVENIGVMVNGVSGSALNLFRGYGVDRGSGGGRACGDFGFGRNCISCFFIEMEKQAAAIASGEVSTSVLNGRLPSGTGWICERHLSADSGGGITAWLAHIYECVCSGNLEHTRWVVDWFCDIVQNPGKSRGTCLAIYGPGFGTGKSSVVEPLKRILGTWNCMTTADTEHIIGRFNASVEATLLVHAEEALWREGKNAASKLKHFITGETVRIERKGLELYDIENHSRLVVTCNELKAVPVVPGERRFAVFRISEHRIGDRNWFGGFVEKADGTWLDCMLDWEIDTEKLYVVPDTDGLMEQKAIGMKDHSDVAMCSWLIDNEWFWDEEGFPVPFVDSALKDAVLGEGACAVGDYHAFAHRLWAQLRGLGLERESKGQKRMNGVVARSYQLKQTLKFARQSWTAKLKQNTK